MKLLKTVSKLVEESKLRYEEACDKGVPEKELDKLENLSTILECAYCSEKNILTFIPDQNEKLEFNCSSCNKLNSVILQFTVIKQNETIQISSLLKDDEDNKEK